MRFSDGDDTVDCDDCDRRISHLDNRGWEDSNLCSGCSARRHQEFVATPCALCKKQMGDVSPYWRDDDPDAVAHEKCVEKLPEKQREDWGNDY